MYFRRWTRQQEEMTKWLFRRYENNSTLAFTATMRQGINVADGQIRHVDYLDERKARGAANRFKHTLHIFLFGKNYKRRGQALVCNLFLERGKLGRYHLHGLIAVPRTHHWFAVLSAAREAWHVNPFGRGYKIYFDSAQPLNGWLKYCLKEGDQALVL